jgi:hypothetical protein
MSVRVCQTLARNGDPLGRRWQSIRIMANELLAQMQATALLKFKKRFKR